MPPAFAIVTPKPSLQERLNEIKNDIQNNNEKIDLEIKDKIRTFFVTSHSIIEEYSAKLIYDEVFQDSIKNKESLNYLLESMSQSHKEDLLFRANLVDGNLKSNLQKVRGVRNDFAHNFALSVDWEGNMKKKAELTVSTVNELYKRIKEENND